VQAHGLGAAAGLKSPTDTANEVAQIHSQLVNTGKIIEGLTGGRVTNTQIQLAADAVVEPGITKEMGKQRVANLRDILLNKVDNVLMGGLPPEQKDAIYKTQGIKPGWLLTAPKTNAAGHKLDEVNSIKFGQPVYVK